MQGRSCWSAVECQSEQVRDVETVGGGPAVGPVADIGGDSFVAGSTDDECHEALIPVAVNGRREADNGCPDAVSSQRQRELGSGSPSTPTNCTRWYRLVPVRLGREIALREPERPGREQEWPVSSGEHLPERLDGAAIRVGGALEVT